MSEFPRELTPALAALLDEAARGFLDDQGLGAEPVSWHPPPHLLDGLGLPGPDPAAVNLVDLHGLTRRDHIALSEIARQLGTTVEVIRYLLEHHPAPASSTVAQRSGRRAARHTAEEAMSRSQFIDLYVVQRRTLADIGALLGVSRKAAGRLARQHGITPHTGGPPVDPAWLYDQYVTPHTRGPPIDPEWFHDQYVNQRRTLRELGHEVGRDVSRMSRIAKRYGIPIRTPSEACRRHN